MDAEFTEKLITSLIGDGIPPEVARGFATSVYPRRFEAGSLLFRTGDRYPPAVFILSGYLKASVLDEEGEEWVRYLAGPGMLYGSLEAILSRTEVAGEQVTCITDCHFIYIERKVANDMLDHPGFMPVIKTQVIRRILELAEERAYLLRLNATERYQYFVEKHPDIAQVARDKDIASFIGIRPQSLSRLKNKL